MNMVELYEPGKMRFREKVETPMPGKGEVLVLVMAAPINPSDIMYTQGLYAMKPKYPSKVGFEGSGIVVAQGNGLQAWRLLGKRVSFIGGIGSWGEYCVVPA